MVVQAFPVAKLGYLLVKQVSKPIATALKSAAKRNRGFRNFVCLPIAQFYHSMETRFKMYLMGLGRPTQVTPLNEQLAVELGADILGESIVFLFAAGTVYFEYSRQAKKSTNKEEELSGRLEDIENKLNYLILQQEKQRELVNELSEFRSSHLQQTPKPAKQRTPKPAEPAAGPSGQSVIPSATPPGMVVVERPAAAADSRSQQTTTISERVNGAADDTAARITGGAPTPAPPAPAPNP